MRVEEEPADVEDGWKYFAGEESFFGDIDAKSEEDDEDHDEVDGEAKALFEVGEGEEPEQEVDGEDEEGAWEEHIYYYICLWDKNKVNLNNDLIYAKLNHLIFKYIVLSITQYSHSLTNFLWTSPAQNKPPRILSTPPSGNKKNSMSSTRTSHRSPSSSRSSSACPQISPQTYPESTSPSSNTTSHAPPSANPPCADSLLSCSDEH